MDFDAALQKVGDFGLYQKLLCAFLVVPSASLCALVYFTQFFTLLVPDHRCKIYENDEFNLSNFTYSNASVQFEETDIILPQKCEIIMKTVNMSFLSNSSIKENVTTCPNGWVYDFEELYPTLATEMNWVCENDQLPYQSQTIFYIGTSIGCIAFGLIADRFGRRPSIILSYIIACAAGIASAFTTSYYTFNFFRFFVGATIIPLSEDPYVLSLEYIGVQKRTIAIIIWSLGYITFSAICPWIAYFLRDWRLLCIITSVPLAAVPLGGMLIPESASWLLTRGRKKEAVKLLKIVARVNKRELPEEFIESPCDKEAEGKNNEDTNSLDLFRTPHMRHNTLVMAVTWFIVYCCYHTNTQNASNLGTNVYDSFTYSALVEIPAQFVILFGIDWLGRRWPVVFSSLAAGLAGLVIIFVPNDSPKTYLGLALVQRVTITIVYNIIMQYSAELLPTVIRGRGLAFLRLMGTLGLYLSPSIVYLSLTMPGLPLVISGVLLLIISAITITLPETLRRHLPHTLEDGENFGKDQRILDCPCIQKGDEIEPCDSPL